MSFATRTSGLTFRCTLLSHEIFKDFFYCRGAHPLRRVTHPTTICLCSKWDDSEGLNLSIMCHPMHDDARGTKNNWVLEKDEIKSGWIDWIVDNNNGLYLERWSFTPLLNLSVFYCNWSLFQFSRVFLVYFSSSHLKSSFLDHDARRGQQPRWN